jgi:hypothetical protein
MINYSVTNCKTNFRDSTFFVESNKNAVETLVYTNYKPDATKTVSHCVGLNNRKEELMMKRQTKTVQLGGAGGR